MGCENAITSMILPVILFIYKCKMGLGLGFRLDYVIDFFFWAYKITLRFNNIKTFACNFCCQDKIVSKWKPMTTLIFL